MAILAGKEIRATVDGVPFYGPPVLGTGNEDGICVVPATPHGGYECYFILDASSQVVQVYTKTRPGKSLLIPVHRVCLKIARLVIAQNKQFGCLGLQNLHDLLNVLHRRFNTDGALDWRLVEPRNYYMPREWKMAWMGRDFRYSYDVSP